MHTVDKNGKSRNAEKRMFFPDQSIVTWQRNKRTATNKIKKRNVNIEHGKKRK